MKYIKKIVLLLFCNATILLAVSAGESADFKYGLRLYNDKIYDVCVSQFQAFLEKYPKSLQAAEAHFYIAESFLKQEKKEKAVNYFQQLILNFPSAPKTEMALIKLAELYADSEKEKAARYYLQVGNYFPSATKVPEYTYRAIKIFFDLQNFKVAEENIRLLEQKFRNNFYTKKALILLSKIYLRKNMSEMAINNYQRLVKDSRVTAEYLEVVYEYSKDLLKLKKHNNALKILKNAVTKGKNLKNEFYYKSVILLANINLQNKNYPEIEKLLKNLKNVPAEFSSAIYELRGEKAFAEGKYTEAFTFFNTAEKELKSEEERFKIIYKIAVAKEKLKDLSSAADLLKSTLLKAKAAKNVNKKEVKLLLTKSIDLNYQLGLTGEAKQLIDDFEEFKLFTNEELAEFNYKSALASYNKADYDQAVKKFTSFIAANSRYHLIDKAFYYTAEASVKSKNYNEAKKYYAKILTSFPASEFYGMAKRNLEQLEAYYLKSNEIGVMVADLSARNLVADEEGKKELLYFWGKLFLEDLKDYEKSEFYLDLYLKSNPTDKSKILESEFLKAFAREQNIKATDADLQKAYDEYARIVNNNSTNLPVVRKAAINQLKLRNRISSEKLISQSELSKNLLDKNFFDETGFVNYIYSKSLFNSGKFSEFLLKTSEFSKYFANSEYVDEIIFLRGEAYNKTGDLTSAMVSYQSLVIEKNSLWQMKALEKLIAFSNQGFEAKIKMINKLKEDYFYTYQGQNAELEKARLYVAHNKLQSALQTYLQLQQEIDKKILSPRWNFLEQNYNEEIADIYFLQKNYDLAETYYLASLQSLKGNEEQLKILKELNEIYTIRHDQEALEANLKQIARISGSDESFYASLSLADLEFTKGNYKTSQEKYQSLLKTKGISTKDEMLLSFKIIKAQLRRDRITKASSSFDQFKKKFKGLFKISDLEPEYIIEKSDSYLRLKNYTKALKGYDDLEDDYEDTDFMPRALYGQSRVYLNIGKKEKSYELLDTIIKKYSSSDEAVKAKYQLSDIYLNQEKYDVALRYLEPVLNADNHVDLQKSAYKKIIDLYIKLGLNDAASRTIRQYVLRFPDEQDVFQKRIEIGNIYQRNGEFEKALEYFNLLLLEADSDDEAAVQFFIAETYFQKKMYRRAISEFLKVRYLIRSNSPYDWGITAIYKASQAYEKLNEYNKAIKLLEQITEKYKSNTKYGRHARNEIDRLKKMQ